MIDFCVLTALVINVHNATSSCMHVHVRACMCVWCAYVHVCVCLSDCVILSALLCTLIYMSDAGDQSPSLVTS